MRQILILAAGLSSLIATPSRAVDCTAECPDGTRCSCLQTCEISASEGIALCADGTCIGIQGACKWKPVGGTWQINETLWCNGGQQCPMSLSDAETGQEASPSRAGDDEPQWVIASTYGEKAGPIDPNKFAILSTSDEGFAYDRIERLFGEGSKRQSSELLSAENYLLIHVEPVRPAVAVASRLLKKQLPFVADDVNVVFQAATNSRQRVERIRILYSSSGSDALDKRIARHLRHQLRAWARDSRESPTEFFGFVRIEKNHIIARGTTGMYLR